MYTVSDEYKLAVADSHRKSKMRAVLEIGSNAINLYDSDIIKDTVYITGQSTNGNEYEYGCVYASECGITIKSAIDRYALYNAKISLFWSLWTGAEWEEIPLGVFYVSEPTRINDKISIKALDGMTKLDVDIDEDTQGTMPELVYYIADKCGVEVSQTSDELSVFTNSNVQYAVYSDKIATYRDLLAYVCQVSACFAVFDRFGKLKLVQYATDPCVELGRKQRFTNAKFSDYTTKFCGVKARFIAEENYAPYEVGEGSDGLVLDMGDNPIVRGLPETKRNVLNAVYDVLKNVSYTPFEIETLGNPALDLGDYVKNNEVGNDNNSYISPITYYYWTYRGKHKLRGVGGNPKLAGISSKQAKSIISLEGNIESKNITIKNYSNSSKITFSNKEVEIARFNYAATENSKTIFLMTARLELSLDGILMIKFYNDAAEDKDRIYRAYLPRGEHFITLTELYTAETNERQKISVRACMEYFESDTRKQDADIKTGNNFLNAIKTTGATVTDNVVTFPTYEVAEIDTAIPTATIKKGGVKAIMYGQGIAGEGKWDGTLNFSETIKTLSSFSGGIDFSKNFNVGFNISKQTPTAAGFNVQISTIPFSGGVSFNSNVAESLVFGTIINNYVFNTDYADKYTLDKYITTNNDMFALKTIYNYESTEQTIDSGKMCSLAIDYTGIQVESVVVNNG